MYVSLLYGTEQSGGGPMKLGYVSATDVVDPTGGASRTAKMWFDNLIERGFDVHVVCLGEDETTLTVDGIRVHTVTPPRPYETIRSHLEAIDPDVVLTQNVWSDLALDAADELDIPSVFSVVSAIGDEEHLRSFSPTKFVANSRYTQQWIADQWGRDSTLVYPTIDFDFYDLETDRNVSRTHGEYITIINPASRKGGEIFHSVADSLPERSFCAKVGWYGLRDESYNFSLESQAPIAQTFFGGIDVAPEQAISEPSFDDLDNVDYITEKKIREVYADTRLLVVPSQWRETFGRVVLEAMYNRIPVVSSHRGALPEACDGAGLLVEDWSNPDEWREKIERMDDPSVYETFASRGKQRAERFRSRQDEQYDRLADVLRRAADDFPADS